MSTTAPSENDVLLGRGYHIRLHPGNQHFRSVVDRYRPEFAEAQRRRKRAIALEVMEEIQGLRPPGRFLEEPGGPTSTPFDSKEWVVVDHDKALVKVLHRFREKSPAAQECDGGMEGKKEGRNNLAGANIVDDYAQCPSNGGDDVLFVTNFFQGQLERDNGTTFGHSDSLSIMRRLVEGSTNIRPSIHDHYRDREKITSSWALGGGGDRDAILGAERSSKDATVEEEQLFDKPDLKGAPCSLSMNEWMNTALSLNDGVSYLERAVNLARVLAKHLIDLPSTQAVFKPKEITCDNLVVLVKPGVMSSAENEQQTEIEGVKFHFEDAPSLLLASNHGSVNNQVVNRRLLCAALGNILLKLFSKGRSSSLILSNEHSGMNHMYQNHGNDGHDATASVAKRVAAVALTGDSHYEQAKKLLLDSGTPRSICRLVCDLLDTMNNKPSSGAAAHVTLKQGLWDLTQMKNNPQRFLFEHTSPEQALDDTCLFDGSNGVLFGREKEMNALMSVKECFQHINQTHSQACGSPTLGDSFLCKAVFLAGYAGSGKSCLLRSLTKSCEEDKWFILKSKFDIKSAPLGILANAFNEFFGRWGTPSGEAYRQLDQSMLKSFQQVCGTIFQPLMKKHLANCVS